MSDAPQLGGGLDFRGRTVLITGAGAGLGRACALEFGRRGANVVVNNPVRPDAAAAGTDKAAAVAEAIADAGGCALPNRDDVRTPGGGEALVRAALGSFGSLDVVVHAAGRLRDRSASRMSPEEVHDVLDVHLGGAFHLALPAYRAMRDGSGGCFLFLSSAAGIFGNPGQANYAAAKMGLLGLSSVLALEGARHGIRSNVVSPYARTETTQEFLDGLGLEVTPEQVTPLLVALCASGSTVTQRVLSAGGGHFAPIVVGLGEGWTAPGGHPSAEDVLDHMDRILEPGELRFPREAREEIQDLVERLSGSA